MKAGDIVTLKKQDYPECLEGTPDGRIFYKVLGDPGEKVHPLLKLFYIGRWQRGEAKRISCILSPKSAWAPVDETQFRLATQEERVQLALAQFME